MKKSLIALAALAAASAFADSPAFQPGDKFEAPEADADKLIAAGSAKLDEAAEATKPKPGVKRSKARLLVDCVYGNANDVVDLDADQLKEAKGAGLADDNKAGITYAAGLPQNNLPA